MGFNQVGFSPPIPPSPLHQSRTLSYIHFVTILKLPPTNMDIYVFILIWNQFRADLIVLLENIIYLIPPTGLHCPPDWWLCLWLLHRITTAALPWLLGCPPATSGDAGPGKSEGRLTGQLVPDFPRVKI